MDQADEESYLQTMLHSLAAAKWVSISLFLSYLSQLKDVR